jgi:hypothetical protein
MAVKGRIERMAQKGISFFTLITFVPVMLSEKALHPQQAAESTVGPV